MAKKISELPSLDNVSGNEVIPVLIEGDNKTIKVDNIKDYLSTPSDYITIKEGEKKYRVNVKDGKLNIMDEEAFTATLPEEGDNLNYDGLIINQMYGAGVGTSAASLVTPVSHSFIELYNLRTTPVNLRGLYLWYRAKAGTWQSLPLVGIVPPKHSFLIKCRQQMDPTDANVTIPIIDYDMFWDIQLSNQGFSVYLSIGNTTPPENPVRYTYDVSGAISSTNGTYIDLLAAGGKNEGETVLAYETRYLRCMDYHTGVRRVDFANSGKINIGSNALVKGNNEADCQPIDFSNCDPEKYRPRSLKDGAWNEFFDKEKQSLTIPSLINISFDELGTGRCFCFRTPITNEGYVYYRPVNDSFWRSIPTEITIVKDMESSSSVHKCKIEDLPEGIYEYKVGYDGCWSDPAIFEVKNYTDSTPINIIWTSDQQSWTIREYDVWKVAAKYIRSSLNIGNIDFHLNTGDISQNAIRSFEWRLYYKYAGELTKSIPHMITCGNNDLINKDYSDAYANYIYEDNKFANSVYAFDLGYTHFVCLNSNEDDTYVRNGTYANTNAFLQAQMDWFDQHMTEVKAREVPPRWVIVYAHLSPFTVGRTKRLQRWVSYFEKWEVDLVLCGHNHAYSRSIPLQTGYDFNSSPAYNDYVTKQDQSSELKIVNEYKADGVTEINRAADTSRGVVYILNHACGFKLSGKEKPITLPTNLQGTVHANSNGEPWWIAKQALPKNPVVCKLQITYNKIDFYAYEIRGIINYDEFKNTLINEDLSLVSLQQLDSLRISRDSSGKTIVGTILDE